MTSLSSSPQPERDLESIRDYIAVDSPRYEARIKPWLGEPPTLYGWTRRVGYPELTKQGFGRAGGEEGVRVRVERRLHDSSVVQEVCLGRLD